MKGILFKPDIWEAKKKVLETYGEAQTRRIIKPQPRVKDGAFCWELHNQLITFYMDKPIDLGKYARYQAGDVVYVKEVWAKVYQDWPPDSDDSPFVIEYKSDTGNKYPGHWPEEAKDDEACGRWKSPLHLKAIHARTFLKITDVRAERLQEISWEDTHKEGILRFDRENPDPSNGGVCYNRGATGLPMRYESTTAYMDLWNSINKPPYDWKANPWVFAYTFKVVPPPAQGVK